MTQRVPVAMEYLTVDELKLRTQRERKYRNVPTEVDGIRFDSKKEARRWRQLQAAQSAGAISNLERQVRFDLHGVGEVKLATYVADFVYLQDGERIVEDVKSAATKKHPMYVLKKKWMRLEHNVEIREW